MVEVRLDSVSFRYGRKQVLRDVTWCITPGVTGLLGENGAGKSTLMSILVGMRRPRSGHVSLGGSSETPRVGFVPQRFTTPGEMRLIDTISYAAWLNGVDRRATAPAAQRALEAVDLGGRSHERVRTLSGGQRQRLGVAAGLAHDPDVLVLDEPTVGLDPSQRLRVREVLTALGGKRTVLLSTHVLDDVQFLCHRVGVLAGGTIAFDGTVDELTSALAQPNHPGNGLESALERGYRTFMDTLGDDR
ncbi:ABC transporter ATP-binding protein [Prauserella alba]|uniref:ABC transporter ATP-binding protein n=1 Tax=Prauserella alba TaxID=176898 RepID=A0ABN1VN17_9PSEU|nr:ATP-binding cassette domain-containing protein [Prauserella alba]MCP2182150.1 ABC-2 type transport system ATP-binding protein [Prauserella alba]